MNYIQTVLIFHKQPLPGYQFAVGVVSAAEVAAVAAGNAAYFAGNDAGLCPGTVGPAAAAAGCLVSRLMEMDVEMHHPNLNKQQHHITFRGEYIYSFILIKCCFHVHSLT
jgi:hypothetical protein